MPNLYNLLGALYAVRGAKCALWHADTLEWEVFTGDEYMGVISDGKMINRGVVARDFPAVDLGSLPSL